MSKIHWFPGHMAKALRDMADEASKVDMVIYVLDSRAPISSVNPEFVAIIGDKPILYVLNKADMVEERDLIRFKAHFKKENTEIIIINLKLFLTPVCNFLLKSKLNLLDIFALAVV